MVFQQSAPELTYESLSKPECIFAAIWHNPEGTVSTEAIAQYYQIPTSYLLDVCNIHHEEIGITGEKWTPRAAIRIGLLLNSPIATAVRSLALDVIEAYKQPSKRTSIRFLLENTQFVEWSDRSIARILECSRTEVGRVRKELEDNGNILQFKKRKHIREDKEIERGNKDSNPLMSGTGHEQHSNPDSPVTKVKVSLQSHDRLGQEGMVVKENPRHWQKVVRFDDGEEVTFADTDFDILNPPPIQNGEVEQELEIVESGLEIEQNSQSPIERRYPREYEEAIAQLKLQHQQEIEQLEQQLRAGLQTEAEARAIEQVREQLITSQTLASDKAKEVAKLQQTVEELQSLRTLEAENQLLQQRIGELERALENRPVQEWGHTFSKQAEKAININTIRMVEALEPELHLRSLATSPPADATEALRLMTLAMGNMAQALGSTQLLSAAAILLKCHPTSEAIAICMERSHLADQAVADIRRELAKGSGYEELRSVASEYDAIRQEYWNRLTQIEQEFIKGLKNDFEEEERSMNSPTNSLIQQEAQTLATNQRPSDFVEANAEHQFPDLSPIQVGEKVSHSDKYSALYLKNGTVTEEINSEEVNLVWSDDEEQRPKRYFKTDLRLA